MNIRDFIAELSGFAETAEKTLKGIEGGGEGARHLFSVFTERMIAIRGTALQLSLGEVAKIAELGEEISVKAEKAENNAQVRRCVGALWDALTTVKYLLEHHDEETSEEQDILINRLENTLRVLGGKRETFSADEIEDIFKKLSAR